MIEIADQIHPVELPDGQAQPAFASAAAQFASPGREVEPFDRAAVDDDRSDALDAVEDLSVGDRRAGVVGNGRCSLRACGVDRSRRQGLLVWSLRRALRSVSRL